MGQQALGGAGLRGQARRVCSCPRACCHGNQLDNRQRSPNPPQCHFYNEHSQKYIIYFLFFLSFFFTCCRAVRCHFAMQHLPSSLASSHTFRLPVSFHFHSPATVACVCVEYSDGERFDFLVMNVVVTAVKRGLRSRQEVHDLNNAVCEINLSLSPVCKT